MGERKTTPRLSSKNPTKAQATCSGR